MIVKTAAVFVLLSSAGAAQTAPRFEVASIKLVPDSGGSCRGEGGPGTKNPERFRSNCNSLSWLIKLAYDIKAYQLVAPNWTETARFEVEAKIRPGATKEDFQLMLQNMLAERLQLKVHWEKREGDVYELSVDKSTTKLKAGSSSVDQSETPGVPYRGSYLVLRRDHATIHAVNEPVSYLVDQLSSYFDLPVTDATALTGMYDFELSWTPDPLAVAPDAVALPTLTDAVRQQLGLRLIRKKGMIDTTVVDYVARSPTAN